MIDPSDLWISEEQVRVHLARKKDGKRKSRLKKKPRIDFLKVSVALAHKLHDEGVSGSTWAMVMALTEAWYTTGFCSQHLNPFPLSVLDPKRWGFTRKQKSRTLQLLTRIHLIHIDRQELNNPQVTIAWEPRYPL
jgi:hypothetical protein